MPWKDHTSCFFVLIAIHVAYLSGIARLQIWNQLRFAGEKSYHEWHWRVAVGNRSQSHKTPRDGIPY